MEKVALGALLLASAMVVGQALWRVFHRQHRVVRRISSRQLPPGDQGMGWAFLVGAVCLMVVNCGVTHHGLRLEACAEAALICCVVTAAGWGVGTWAVTRRAAANPAGLLARRQVIAGVTVAVLATTIGTCLPG